MNEATLSRRSLLAGLATAATAASGAAASAYQAENPELLALADQLPELAEEHAAASGAVRRIVAEWSPHWPTPDPEIVRYSQGSKTHRGIDGRGIATAWSRSGTTDVKQLGTPEVFAASAASHRSEAARKAKTKSQRGMKFHLHHAEEDEALIEPARAYWSEVDRITEASGIEEAKERLTAAREALERHIDAIMAAEDRTIAGAAIKAEAIEEWGKIDLFYRMLNPKGPDWAEALAQSIMRHARAAA